MTDQLKITDCIEPDIQPCFLVTCNCCWHEKAIKADTEEQAKAQVKDLGYKQIVTSDTHYSSVCRSCQREFLEN